MAKHPHKSSVRITADDDDDAPIVPTTTEDIPEIGHPDGGIPSDMDAPVVFACFEDIAPAPVIGHYRFADHDVSELKARQNYTMPGYVAMWLVERKKGTIVG